MNVLNEIKIRSLDEPGPGYACVFTAVPEDKRRFFEQPREVLSHA